MVARSTTSPGVRGDLRQMHAREAVAKGGRHFVVDGASLGGDLIGLDAGTHLLADQDELVGVGYIIKIAQIDGDAVHAHGANDRATDAADPGAG